MTLISSAWAASETVQVSTDTGALHAISTASIVVQLTLACLIMMSVVSWAIMLMKRRQFATVEKKNVPFEDSFWRASTLEQVHDHVADHPESNLAVIFRQGYLEMKRLAEGAGNSLTLGAGGIDNLERSLRKAIDLEVARLESRLIFLATVGSVGPFIGLFGTVWGIMSSFQKIGQTGVASLAVVAPGIAEALIATGVGLAAAIPASIGYNLFVTRIRKQELGLNNFASDFLNLAKRNVFKGA